MFSGLHRGRSSCVRLAAIIPVISARDMGSPFSVSPFRIRPTVLRLSLILPDAVAVLNVMGFFEVSDCLKITTRSAEQVDVSLLRFSTGSFIAIRTSFAELDY